MRRLLFAASLACAPAAAAEIRSAEACTAAIAEDAAAAREDAAQWSRLGGGVESRLCEAAALEAIGAGLTAARLLTELAQDTNRAMPPALRATIFEDAARLWREAGRADLARAALTGADRLVPPDASRLVARARAEAAEADWPAARASIEAALALAPEDATALALHAATLRRTGEPEVARAEADRARARDPASAEALFEAAAARAALGEPEAADLWLALIAAHPGTELAALAARNLQTAGAPPEARPLSAAPAAAPPPSRPHPAPPDPGPRPAPRPRR